MELKGQNRTRRSCRKSIDRNPPNWNHRLRWSPHRSAPSGRRHRSRVNVLRSRFGSGPANMVGHGCIACRPLAVSLNSDGRSRLRIGLVLRRCSSMQSHDRSISCRFTRTQNSCLGRSVQHRNDDHRNDSGSTSKGEGPAL